MKRLLWAGAGILLLGAIVWLVYTYRADLGLSGHAGGQQASSAAWRAVDRSADGFKVDMPAGVTQTEIPAFNERGALEPVRVIQASIDPETTYAVAWAETPPVERAGIGDGPDRTLDYARDGALKRTGTTLIDESRNERYGNPSRDFSARNSDGGILNARLILAGARLYMLVATFPNPGARRNDDLNRFFSSFNLTAAVRPSPRTE